jgi:hypothetical protein
MINAAAGRSCARAICSTYWRNDPRITSDWSCLSGGMNGRLSSNDAANHSAPTISATSPRHIMFRSNCIMAITFVYGYTKALGYYYIRRNGPGFHT